MNTELADLKIVIIGLGLIGGSIARGLSGPKSGQKLCREIIGVGRNEEMLQQALSDGMITDYSTDVSAACADADLVVIAVPSMTVEAVLEQLKPVVNKNTSEIYYELVPFDKKLAQEASDKAVDILTSIKANDILPRIAQSRDFFLCKFCEYQDSCWGE